MAGQPCIFLKALLKRAHQCLLFLLRRASVLGFQTVNRGKQAALILNKFINECAGNALDQYADIIARQTQNLLDSTNRAEQKQIVRLGYIRADILLSGQENTLTRLHGFFQRLHGNQAPDIKMYEHLRERNQSAQRQYRQCLQLQLEYLCHMFYLPFRQRERCLSAGKAPVTPTEAVW